MLAFAELMKTLAIALAIAGLFYCGRRAVRYVDSLLEDQLYKEIVFDLRSDTYAVVPATWARGGKNGWRIKELMARLLADFPADQWQLTLRYGGGAL
ncbi:MAG: hypothetical protein ACN6OP_30275, partial [Pseudomonadales bacterium]